MNNKPPFTISARAIGLMMNIAAQLERYALLFEGPGGVELRRTNRIQSVRSSLAIEGNCLTEAEVAAIYEGKPVVAPLREIQEAKNAFAVYERFDRLHPCSIDDLLAAHELLMRALLDESGRFRRRGVGIYSGTQLVYAAPSAKLVPFLMADLFDWLKNSTDPALIKGCVFHYEFETIHPFEDGNGRMGRLWQSLILAQWNPLFAHIPVENLVDANRQGYYNAIEQSREDNDSGAFIDFMLTEISNTIADRVAAAIKPKTISLNADNNIDYYPNVSINVRINVSINEQKLLDVIKENPRITAKQIAEQFGISERQAIRTFESLKNKGVIHRVGARKTGYWQISDTQ